MMRSLAVVARALWPLCCVLVAIGAVSAATTDVDRIAALPDAVRLAIRAMAFGLIAFALLSHGGHARTRRFRDGTFRQLIVAGGVIAATMVVAGSSFSSVPQLALLATISAAAAVEEIVFRQLLPRQIARDLAPRTSPVITNAVAVGLSQIAFAVGHFLPVSPLAWDVGRFCYLVVAGIALWVVVQGAGLWLAVSLHALTNIWVAAPPEGYVASSNFGPVTLAAAGIGSLSVLWYRRIWRRQLTDDEWTCGP